MDGILKTNPFSFPKIKDLFLFTKKEKDDDEPEEEKEGDEMPKWAKSFLDKLSPNLPQEQVQQVPTPPAPKKEEEEEEDPLEAPPNPLKKFLDWLM